MCMLCVGAAMAGAPMRPVTSFEDVSVMSLEANVAAPMLTADHATDGRQALLVEFGSSGNYPGVTLSTEKGLVPSDWTGYGALVFDLYYANSEKLKLNVRLDSEGEDGDVSVQTAFEIPSKRQVTVSVALPREVPHMHAGPPAFVGDVSAALRSTDLDLSRVTGLTLFLEKPEAARTIYFDDVRLAPEVPIRDLVDRYGQYTGAEWPGKAHSDADLAADLEQETAWLAEMGEPPAFDEYGGWVDGPRLEATGWFRTEKADGKWWLVTPEGHLFWSTGLDCVNTQNGGPIAGRPELFTWFPEAASPLARFGTAETSDVNFYEMNCFRKYGSDFRGPWMDHTRARLRAWGFNTVAAWSDQTFTESRMPFTCTLWSGAAPTVQGVWNTVPDFFDPAWPETARTEMRQKLDLYRENPLCMGYFVDNEIAWGYFWHGRTCYTVPINALGLGEDSAAKRALTGILEAKYRDIAGLNAVWDLEITSWDAFRTEPVPVPEELSPAVREDLSLLLTAYAERYFSTVSAIVKEYAPNQLYLGQRFGGIAPAEVVEVAERYCDVVSYNIYGDADSLTAHARHVMDTEKPGLIGEFHFCAMDRGMFASDVDNQAMRGAKYAEYIRRALDLDWCVGAHWFTYADQPLVGRFDGENANIGFVSQTDQPYYELIEPATEANRGMYEYRSKP